MTDESDMDTTDAEAPADKDWETEAAKWKALARKHEEGAKANAAAAKRLAEIEAAQKSAEEKAAEARAQAERERDEARLELLKRDAAEAAGLPRGWASRLRGTTKEELEADAKELAKEVGPKDAQTPARPVPELRSGALPAGAANAPFDANAYIRAQARK